jgi:hypothetical protein
VAETQGFKARVEYEVTDDAQRLYTFPFSYLRKKFIKVDVLHADNSITTLTYGVDYVVNDLSLTLTNPAKVGEHLIIYRQTTTDKIITWNDGSILLARDMNTEDVQMLHLQEEQQDYIQAHSINTKTDSATKEVLWDALNHRVINVSDPKDPQDAVTKHYMENVQGGFVAANTILVQEATKQASAAKASQEAAKTSETNAHTSETNSEISHQNAKKWAEATESPDGEADTDSTTGKTQSSRSWALYSKAKAQEAATSATNAKTSETNAKASETNAKTSETKAATSEANAKTSEINAKSSETKSKASENSARVSEQNAAESARIATEYGGDFKMLKRNKAYSVGDIAYSPNLPSWAYLECTTAGTTGATEPDFSTGFTEKTVTILSKFTVLDGTCTWRLRDTRCKYEVGDIIPKVGSPKAYEYLILADGSDFDTTVYTELAKVFTDGKVPNLTDGRFLEGGVTAGQVKGAGLPNITGEFGFLYTFNDQITTKGALKGNVLDDKNQHTPYPNDNRNGAKIIYNFNASYSNNIYGSSNTVQPKSYTVKYYICYGG